jgi:exodeoxyribonuclease VIII
MNDEAQDAPPTNIHVMIDLETLSTRPDAAILSIGAVKFDLWNNKLLDSFHQAIDIGSCLEAGLKVEGSTLGFWLSEKQADARREIYAMETVELFYVLEGLGAWLLDDGGVKGVWGNGATFDNVIMASAYRAAQLPLPWTHKQDRCFRTIKNLYPAVEVADEGTAHTALADAKWQARYMLRLAEIDYHLRSCN